MSLHRGMPLPASGPNEHWSMDFVHDQTSLDLGAFGGMVAIFWEHELTAIMAKCSKFIEFLGLFQPFCLMVTPAHYLQKFFFSIHTHMN